MVHGVAASVLARGRLRPCTAVRTDIRASGHWGDGWDGAVSASHADASAGPAALLDTLSADMVTKQAALERLQRQLEASDARCNTAAMRLSDLSNRNE